jgi:hypothetical protein
VLVVAVVDHEPAVDLAEPVLADPVQERELGRCEPACIAAWSCASLLPG